MITSEALDKFAPAFLKAQMEMDNASKNANNPAFRTKYANLEGVIDAVKPALNANGIAILQSGSPSQSGQLTMTTRLLHTSGQWIEDTAECQLSKNDPQGFGSAMTYLRRYNAAAICGITQEDDDGNAASQPSQSFTQGRAQSREPANGNGAAAKAQQTRAQTLSQVRDHIDAFLQKTSDPDGWLQYIHAESAVDVKHRSDLDAIPEPVVNAIWKEMQDRIKAANS